MEKKELKFIIECLKCGDKIEIRSDNGYYNSDTKNNMKFNAVENSAYLFCECGNYVETY